TNFESSRDTCRISAGFGTSSCWSQPEMQRIRGISNRFVSQHLIAIPCDCLLQTFVKPDPRAKAEFAFGPRSVQPPARLAVGLRSVPYQASPEPGYCGDLFGQVFDRYFKTRPEVDRFRLVVFLSGQQDAPRAIVRVQELSCGGAGSPANDV